MCFGKLSVSVNVVLCVQVSQHKKKKCKINLILSEIIKNLKSNYFPLRNVQSRESISSIHSSQCASNYVFNVFKKYINKNNFAFFERRFWTTISRNKIINVISSAFFRFGLPLNTWTQYVYSVLARRGGCQSPWVNIRVKPSPCKSINTLRPRPLVMQPELCKQPNFS